MLQAADRLLLVHMADADFLPDNLEVFGAFGTCVFENLRVSRLQSIQAGGFPCFTRGAFLALFSPEVFLSMQFSG